MAYWAEYHKEVDQIELRQVGISISSKGCFEIEAFLWSEVFWIDLTISWKIMVQKLFHCLIL